MTSLVDGREVVADSADFRVTDFRIEDFSENFELPLARQLLVVEVVWIRDDGASAGSFNLVLYPALNRIPHLKYTVQWKICGTEYLCFCCPRAESTECCYWQSLLEMDPWNVWTWATVFSFKG